MTRRWSALRILIVLGVIGTCLRPPPGLVLLGPPQHVSSINPKIGVHTRLTEEVEEWKIKRTLELVREMGASWIVEYFPWAYYEPQKGVFAWDHADMVVRHARQQGLTVIARIGFVPGWARPPDTTESFLPVSSYDDLGDFVYSFVSHYRGQIDHVIIWNEPNLSFEWGFRPPDPAGYVEMLRVAYRRAHEANPDVRVLAGALAPTPGGDPTQAMDDLSYLEGMYRAGAGPWFDVLAAHAYGWRFAPDEPPAPDAINFRRVELLRAIMEQYGDGDKPIMITEGGWNDHPRWTKAVRPAQRAAYTVRAFELAQHEWPWCQAVALWVFRFPRPQGGYLDYFTFVTVDFTLKPVYRQVRRYAAGEDVRAEWDE